MDLTEDTISSSAAPSIASTSSQLERKFFCLRDLWRDLRDAIQETGMDYTQGSIEHAILLLSVPMMLAGCSAAGSGNECRWSWKWAIGAD